METETKTYYGAVDYVKAIAIVAVIITHAGLRGSDPNISAFEKVLRQSWVGFQVPAFFLVAGFLYHKSQKLPWSEIGRRLIRIIIPYLVASSVALLIGFGRPLSADKILFDLATGNVVGIYYFVFVLCLCIPFSWLYSRLPRPALWMILMLLVGYSALIAFGYLSRPSTTFFWSVRGLFFTFFLGYFTTGWLVAEHLESLKAFALARKNLLLIPLGLAAAIYATLKAQAFGSGTSPPRSFAFFKIGYTLAVTSLIVLISHRLSVPRFVRFLSEASLTLYLYHRLIQLELLPLTRDWEVLTRVSFLLLAGLLGASLLALAGRKLFPKRSRFFLGY